jgi:hypothetical protein
LTGDEAQLYQNRGFVVSDRFETLGLKTELLDVSADSLGDDLFRAK